MKIYCLFAQQKERYPGEYAPDLIAAIDEFGDDENPGYLYEEEKKLAARNDIDFYKRLEIEVPDEAFDEAFFPNYKPLSGTVKEAK